MTTAEKKPKVKVMTITPQAAQDYLAKNTRNRPHSERKVEEYYKAMKDGEWHLTTDAIGFDTNGLMINGQHRMMALVKYGKPLDFLISTGLEPDAFNFIDTGKVRNSGDVLGANGFTAGHHKSAIVKWVMAWKRGLVATGKEGKRDVSVNNQDILEYAVKYKSKLEEAYTVSLQVGKDFKGLKGQVIGGLYWILHEIDRNQALVFFGALGTGSMLSTDNPIYVLRQRLLDDLHAKKKFPTRDKLAWTIIAWNHARDDKKIKQIKWDGKNFPKPY